MDGEGIKKSILDDGFFFIKDPEYGRKADTFASKGYPFQTEAGLDFLSATLDDTLIRDTIESSLKHCGLGMFKPFGSHPNTARAPLNRTTSELLALNVLICRSRSRVILHKGSHMHELDANPGGIGLLELPRESLSEPGITPVEVKMDDGGLIITDGRLFSTVLEGVVLGVGFAVEKELKEWGKMMLPKMPNLEQKVAQMNTDRIRMNFQFVEVTRSE
ncbi:hypothetical protein M430DRAFT_240621 [Amorphotheca resinae ATCC 22711]|uniref:Uncharacterized protein n=1 Tax=Amorphotheca resinae ATCC 22711 TaxID=857342 RepID=A0A2T3B1T9_AMORE|nr:hypothetical protein M430DRAFT_240621 [Amorphotheca resinae ATCC 22711]PSS18520.1 hypothetical protein M430DRAFT_240621 [Amorphotheca resinae ATCC 22711]